MQKNKNEKKTDKIDKEKEPVISFWRRHDGHTYPLTVTK